jgi:hypothetical protein
MSTNATDCEIKNQDEEEENEKKKGGVLSNALRILSVGAIIYGGVLLGGIIPMASALATGLGALLITLGAAGSAVEIRNAVIEHNEEELSKDRHFRTTPERSMDEVLEPLGRMRKMEDNLPGDGM